MKGTVKQRGWRPPKRSWMQFAENTHLESWAGRGTKGRTRCARDGASSSGHKAHKKQQRVLPGRIKQQPESGILRRMGGSRRCQLLLPASEAGTRWLMGNTWDASRKGRRRKNWLIYPQATNGAKIVLGSGARQKSAALTRQEDAGQRDKDKPVSLQKGCGNGGS